MSYNIPKFFRGYVRIRIFGFQREKIINRFATSSILLWRIILKSNYIEMNISLTDFWRIKSILKGTHTKVKIIKKYGLPFLINKYRGRKIFVIGIFLTLTVLMILSNIVLDINVYGTERIDDEKILAVAKAAGLSKGKPEFVINYDNVVNSLYREIGDIAWLNIYQKGTSVNIDIVETVVKTSESLESTPCDIVADKKAIIHDIVTLSGVPKVKAKDVVNEGDILVSGEIDVEKDGEILKKYVHANAKIEGKMYLFIKEEQELEVAKKTYTGNVYRELQLDLHFGKFDFIKTRPQNSLFEKKERYISLDPFIKENKFGFVLNEYAEYRLEKTIYTIDEAKRRLQKKIYENISLEVSDDTRIIDVRFDYGFKGKRIMVNGIAVLIEKIGQNKTIENTETPETSETKDVP
ncbi:MAG TPA: hypothetical protein DCP90_06025 [Clostridiales bacterium]|nr:MAG: hypothetical protein A2Y22_09275 [Clostridiales bacterium GWD2_32_59]HAN10151.1 hypothetical protein [Clostridiales bacterium]